MAKLKRRHNDEDYMLAFTRFMAFGLSIALAVVFAIEITQIFSS